MAENLRCDVCWLVDEDATPKRTAYCGLCDAWICETCAPNLPRRGLAMIRRLGQAARGLAQPMSLTLGPPREG
jgi:hypothetical protein